MRKQCKLMTILLPISLLILVGCTSESTSMRSDVDSKNKVTEKSKEEQPMDQSTDQTKEPSTEQAKESSTDQTKEPSTEQEKKSYAYDPTIDISYQVLNRYGTTSPFGEMEKKADTSTSTVVNWKNLANVKPGTAHFLETQVYYKKTKITDGYEKGDDIRLKMKVQYHDDTKMPTPAVVFVPGGGFSTAQLTGLPTMRNYIANQGYAVFTIQYRVIGEGLYKDAVADVNDAIRYIKANADQYHVDPEKLILLGNSAGGYLAALTATSANNGNNDFLGENNLAYSTDVKGVIDLYGLSDLTKIADDYTNKARRSHEVNTSPESHYVNGVFSGVSIMENKVSAQQADPLTYIDGQEPPFLLFHGDEDLAVSPSQTLILHNALRNAGVASTRYSLKGADHGRGGFDSQPALDRILAFLKEVANES